MKELRPRIINSVDEWKAFQAALKGKGYKLFQTQFSADSPEGYHARFISGEKSVEVITFNLEVEKNITSND